VAEIFLVAGFATGIVEACARDAPDSIAVFFAG